MLRTKQAKKLLTKKEQRHLTEMGIHTMAEMEGQMRFIRAHEGKDEICPCFICRHIGIKLGL
jgi:hypothetical protein